MGRVRSWLTCVGQHVSADFMQAVLEKSIALCLAAANTSATSALADLLANYALRLVDQGAMRSAMTYLGLLDDLPPDAAPALAILRDRVAQAAATEVRRPDSTRTRPRWQTDG